jgi:hypothetical protein
MSKFDPDYNRCMQCYELQPDCICDEDDDRGGEAHGQKTGR